MPTIEKDLGLKHSEAGALFLLISAGYFISLTGAGLLSSCLTHRKTIILSATAVGITLLAISCTKSLTGIRFGLLILGMAAGLYLPSGIATLTSLISSRHWGKGLAIHELAPNLSFVAAPLISEALLQWFSWRGILGLIGAASVAVAVGFAYFGKGGNFPGQAPGLASFQTLLTEPAFWIITVLFSLAIGSSLGIYAMLPLYLVAERGVHRSWANTMVALSRISGLGMAFFSGWATDRFGSRRIMAVVLLLTGMVTVLLGVGPGSWIVIFVFLQPMLAVCFFPAGFAALSSITSSSTRNVAVSLTVPVAFLFGGGAIPAGIGIMGDAGSFALGIALVGGLILTGFVLSLYLKLPDKKERTTPPSWPS